MWAISISSGLSKSLSVLASNHFNIVTFWDYSEHESFYFSSSHLKNIDIKEPNLAFYRAKALLRILNGILMLNNQPAISFNFTSIAYYKNYDIISVHSITHDSQLEYKELQNPFQTDSSLIPTYNEDQLMRKSYEVDVFDLAYSEELVKEVFVLFSLVKTEPLYLLINTLKIIETIEFDLGLQIEKKENGKNKKSSQIKKEKAGILDAISVVLNDESRSFLNAYRFFTISGDVSFKHFINTRDGSGIFARHGANKEIYQDEAGNQLPIISFKEIEHNIQILIYEWVNYKLIKSKGYRYPPNKQISRIVDITDETFDFDL